MPCGETPQQARHLGAAVRAAACVLEVLTELGPGAIGQTRRLALHRRCGNNAQDQSDRDHSR